MKNIAGAIVVVGLAWLSVYAFIATKGEIGSGWGLFSVLTLFFWRWKSK